MIPDDPWALTYEDDTASITDERLTYELLCGVEIRLPNGRPGRIYLTPGSDRERHARAALARLIRQGSPFPSFIRETLAALFDPTSATVPALRRIEFKRLHAGGRDEPEGVTLMIALHVLGRLLRGDKKEAAIASAMEEFSLKRRRVFAVCRKHEALFSLFSLLSQASVQFDK
jgi:hypothetical protein